MTEHFSDWRMTPWWLRAIGKPAWMRDRYASAMIGGGWDGWEFSAQPPTGDAYWHWIKSQPPDPTRQARGMLRRTPKIEKKGKKR